MIRPIGVRPFIRKTVTYAMFAGAAMGLNACNNKGNVDEISYEPNYALEERARFDDSKEIYPLQGLYGGTIHIQQSLDRNQVEYCMKQIKKDKNCEITPEMEEDHFGIGADFQNNLTRQLVQHARDVAKEQLYMNGTPTATQCSEYLDRQISGLSMLSMQDYEKYKQELEDFKKKLGKMNNQKMAELIAFKQFKLDSIIYKDMLVDYGFLKSDLVRYQFERGWFADGKPKIEKIGKKEEP